MKWNYQIIKQDGQYTVHEVIDGDSWTVDEVSPYGETRNEMREAFSNFIYDCITRPILIVEGDKIVGEEGPLGELLASEFTHGNNTKRNDKRVKRG